MPVERSLLPVVSEQVVVHFILDLSGHEVINLGLVHGELPDQRAGDVDAARAGLKEDCLLLGQASVHDTHGELAVKV